VGSANARLPLRPAPTPGGTRRVIRTCVVSDVRLYREGIRQLLDGQRQIAVVAALDYDDDVLAEAARLEPTVLLLDVAGEEGATALRRFVEKLPDVHVVALTVSDSEAEIVACAEAGVDGFVSRTSSVGELVATVESAARGEPVCPPKIAAVLLRRVQTLAETDGHADATARLTRREREVVDLIAAGLSNKQIASRLSIELSTAKNHVHHILEKLGVQQRSDAVAVARRNGSSQI
jgi:two-component system, NarL family, nitrate/nitrite response regulator NarL